jgi:sugar lactone lactonase YvrE
MTEPRAQVLTLAMLVVASGCHMISPFHTAPSAVDGSHGDLDGATDVVGDAAVQDADRAEVSMPDTDGLLPDAPPSDSVGPVPDASIFDAGPSGTGVVSTVSGSAKGFADGPVGSAKFNSPYGLTVDGAGSIYVADTSNHMVRLIAAGQVSTVAGTGQGGQVDGPVSTARFKNPYDVAVDATGAVYVSDTFNHVIRTIAGGQVSTWAGDGKVGSADGPVSSAQFYNPIGIAMDGSGGVYVADSFNNSIRRIASGQVTTLAGDGTPGFVDGPAIPARFNNPTGVAVDGTGKVYVADAGNHRIRVISAGQVSTFAGSGTQGFANGPAAQARFNHPCGVATDSSGTIYVADAGNHQIRMIAAGQVSTLAGNGAPGSADGTGASAQFNAPCGVATDISGTVYVADKGNHSIRMIIP